jgi:hypothetical protein
VALNSLAGVEALLALHEARQVSLDALTLHDYCVYTAEARAALAAALAPAGRLGASLRHVVTHDHDSHAEHDWLHAPVLAALADGAPLLHTLEMRSVSPAGVRYLAALLNGHVAFSLKRLTVLMETDDGGALDALNALATALPATLHTLVLGVQHDFGGAIAPAKKAAHGTAAALRALLFAAAARCPGLRSAQLVTRHDDTRFVNSCRAAVDALAAARPDVRATYRAYTVRHVGISARKSIGGGPLGGPFLWPA